MQNNDFDFIDYFSKFMGNNQPTKEDMFFKYVRGLITKQQLDEFMEGLKDE